MIPFIPTNLGNIPTFPICIAIGILLMLLTLHISLKDSNNRTNEEIFILPRICICLSIAFFSAGLFDSLFKFIEYGIFKFTGITFYGGLIGAIITLYLQLKFKSKDSITEYNINEWFNILIPPVIIFHICGRIGCFMGGCCYGKVTSSIFGVAFPDNIQNNIIHNGVKRYPTQLFEAFVLMLIFVIILLTKHRFKVYMYLYAVARFFLEYFRGDDRGSIFVSLSPAQIISIIIITAFIIFDCRKIAIAKTMLNIKESAHR